jgi:FOG: PKD repeat
MKVRAEFYPLRRVILFLLFLISGFTSFGQTDTEFWFSVPDVTKSHGNPGGQDALLTFSTFDMASTITVSMPADPRFVPIVITVPPRTSQTIKLNKYIDPVAGLPNLENIYNTVSPNNSGLRITATTMVTAYYQIDNPLNSEVYSLKGRNALGTKFYVPFQTIRDNGNYTIQPYSSINVVATEDNTLVTVTPSQNAYMHGVTIAKGTSKQIVLQKGQMICIVPALKGGIPSQLAADRLAGTLVTSDKNVAITTNDDSVNGLTGSADTIGDQILNLDALGKTYVVYRTGLYATEKEDCYVTATEDNTTVTVRNNDGTVTSTYTINAGQQQEVILAGSYCFIDTDKPTSVFHIGGFGRELGGAMIPSIDKCTGSTQVAFNFLTAANKTFNVNIMVRTAGKNSFYLNGTKVNVEAIAGTTWKPLTGTDWWFIQILDWNQKKSPELLANTSNIFSNTGDLFHFGVFYGGSSNSCSYGYFSDFNQLTLEANVGGVDAAQARVCFGTPIQLYARGGTTYKWTPADYLNDAAIFNPIANIPVSGARKYTVEISGACGMTATQDVNIEVFEPVKADFSVDQISGCSPLTVNFKNTSLNAAELKWNFGDSTVSSSSKFIPPGLVEELSHTYTNTSDTARTFTVQLLVKNSAGCGDIIEKKITVYPSVEAKLQRVDPTPVYCSPRSLTFQNVSPPTALPASDITYIWDFGDGGSVNTSDASVSHSFSVFDKTKQRYNVSLTMLNKFGCKSIATDTVDVYGLVKANFTLDKNSGCPNPTFNAVLTDGSTGMISKKTWTWDGFSNTASATIPNAFDISTSNRTTDAAAEDVRTIRLDVEGSGGCKDSYQQNITIHPYVNAQFTIGDNTLCDGEILNIKNTSSVGSTDYYWELGDGTTSTAANPLHQYANSSYATVQYDVKLTAKSASGCQSTYVSPTKVTVYSRIDPNFVVNDLGGCAPFNATIANASKGNSSNTYEWNFGDGYPAVIENTLVTTRQHLFANSTTKPKDYIVDLKVTNEGGCFSSISRTARVYPQPVADFNVDNSLGCNPLPVTFTSSTNEADYDYSWSFDDGAAASQANILHTYNNFDYTTDKTFNPVLTVSSIYGCSSIKTKPIVVHPLLKAAFTVQQLSACAPFDVQVTPKSLGATSYSWNYGDGRTSVKTTSDPFTISYNNTGATSNTYNIGLVATNSGGACQATASAVPVVVDPSVAANGSFVVDDKCMGAVTFTNTSAGGTSYTWDFGDGQSVNSTTPTVQKHVFENRTAAQKTYVVTLTAENAKGCKSTKTFNVDVVPRVESSFAFDVLEKCTPIKINLTNTSLNGTEFQWDYGHTIGGVAQQEIKTTTDPFTRIIDNEDPNQTKTYVITLTTVDKVSGCSAVSSRTLVVTPKVLPSFTNTIVDKCNGKVSFQNVTTGATSYTWLYGDQSSSYTTTTTESVSHTYLNRNAAPATFVAKLVVSNSIGCTAESVQNISIVPKVESNFTLDVVDKCTPIKVNLTNTSLNGTEFQWDYGHTIGGVAQQEIKTTTDPFTRIIDNEDPNQTKTYVITLTTVDKASGCSAVSSRSIAVTPKVLPSFTSAVVDKCNGKVSFQNTTTGAASYTWSYGDQGSSYTTSTTESVSHTYLNRNASSATFVAKLVASNSIGCTAESVQNISIVPKVESGFTLDVLEKCTPIKVNLTNMSLNGTEFQWDYGHTIGGVAQQEIKTTTDPFEKIIDSENPDQVQTYTIKMTALDKVSGCSSVSTKDLIVYPKVVPLFTSNTLDKCNGKISFKNASTGANTYTWFFGDQSSSLTTNKLDTVSHIYMNRNTTSTNFNPKLVASNVIGCSAESVQSITIVPRVESNFAMDVVDKCTPVKVRLTNSSLNGTEFQWDYGHTIGGVAQQEVRTTKDVFDKIIDSENLNQVQTYSIKLTTVDKVTGCSTFSTKSLTVYPRVLPSFSSTVVDKCKGQVSFSNATTGANSYTWFFGDPSSAYTTDKLDAVSHTYLNRNATNTTFNAKLVASNAIGCLAESVRDISIVPRVESSFTLEELEACTPVKVRLTNTSLNGQQFTWDYGHTIGGLPQVDVKTDMLAFEKIIDSESANAIQTYPIKLTVLDKNTQCADDSIINLTVFPRLLPSFTADKLTGCSDLPVTLTNTSTGGKLAYDWDFGDGQSVKTSDVSESVAHTFVNRNSTAKNYSVVLTATNPKGCKVTALKTIGVYPKVEAAFTFTQPSKCTPFPIDITNSSLNGTEYQWDFGHTANGNNRDTLTTSKTGFRTYIYNGNSTNTQTYTLTLTARDAVTGCNDIVKKTIDAQPEVRSVFNLSTDKGCTPLSVSFTNASTGSSAYSWNFGNGTSSASVSPSAMLLANSDTVSIKSYNISLTAKNPDGCANVSTKRVDVYPKVMADFSLDKVGGCTPLAVKLVNAYPSSAYRYEWTLGSNGTSTAQQIPDLNFINSTTDYSIQNEKLKLKVFYRGDASCYKEVERSVAVYPSTRSDFSMDVTEACNPLVVNFSNKTKSYNNAATYNWSFDNLGSSGEVNPKYTFTNISRTDRVSYTVKLKSTSIQGCSDSTTKTVVVRPIPKAQMAINTASGCAPFNVEVQNLSVGSMPTYTFWLDSDKSTSLVRNGNSTVQYNIDNLSDKLKTTEVWLRAVSDFGCKDSTSQKVFTFPHVTSAFTFTPSDAGCNPLKVSFTNSSKNAIYYNWDFDDGVTAHIDSPSHIFQNFQEQDRVFNVKLNAKSEYGCEHTSSKEFTVYSAPIAYFTIDPPLRTYPDASFLFNNLTSPKAANWNYEWTFGDGGKYVGVDPPVYTYKTWGDQKNDYKYFVTLKVSNGNCKDEMTQFLYLKPAIPISIFSSSVGSSCSPLETQFTHQAKYYKSIEWDFGDGTTSTEDSPFHVYKNPGKYQVQLAVKGDGGTTYSYTTLEVFANPVANFKLAPAEAMLPEARVQFYNTSTEGNEYAWDFGDVLGSSTEKNPTYTYKKLGNYDVRLKVTSKNLCVDDTLVKAAVKVVGEGILKFPNAFIPSATGGNGGAYEIPDYKNEVFHPTSEGVVTYKLQIYNRWGERLFESNDVSKGWDGYYKGKFCEQGVYVYRATGRFTNGKTFDIRGDVTLLR